MNQLGATESARRNFLQQVHRDATTRLLHPWEDGRLRMNTRPSSNSTVSYYDRNATEFSRGTMDLDLSHLYKEFLSCVPKGGRILDAGCGTGRDAVYFKSKGYEVVAFDACRELAATASLVLNDPVEVMEFAHLA